MTSCPASCLLLLPPIYPLPCCPSAESHNDPEHLFFLQEHIIQRLLPVKARMLAQLARQQQQQSPATSTSTTSHEQSTTGPSDGNLFLGGGININAKDDATAVSDGWAVGTPTSDSPSGGGGGRLGPSLTSSGHLSGTTSSASLPRPCSSLSFADLGDLCGDGEGADDGCGGVFLVGGDDCDDVNGSGIGLDLYDLGQVCVCVCVLCFVPLLLCGLMARCEAEFR